MRRQQLVNILAGLAILAAVVSLAACGGEDSSSSGAITVVPASANLSPLQSDFVATVKAVSPAVVEVQNPVGLGSGVVLDTKGNIVTNAHVVGSYARFKVLDWRGKVYSATLVGKFVPDDLAVIHVSGLNLPHLTFANSSKIQVGDLVLAIGNPLGYQSSVSQGIVSALGRTVTEQTGTGLADVIQTTAAINPGNSGGALVDLRGRLVGIPTLAAVDNETQQLANGIGFAIPSNTVKQIADQIVRHGHVVRSGRAYLGVRLATLVSGQAAIVKVNRNGPAAAAGIVAGDIITAIDGEAVQSVDDVAALLANLRPGAKADVKVRTPAGHTKTLTVTLGQYPGT